MKRAVLVLLLMSIVIAFPRAQAPTEKLDYVMLGAHFDSVAASTGATA
jgi:hypothetical protein